MKKTIFKTALVFVLALTVASFISISEKTVNVKESKITWKGYKVTGEHAGEISLKGGTLTFSDHQLTGGSFLMDMTSLIVTDLEGDYKGKLEGHLKSGDFFGTEAHPTATFEIKSVEGTGSNVKVTGDLTIKGITKTSTFDMVVSEDSATAALKIDRTKFGIEYKSNSFFDNLKDKAIYDEFDLNVNLKF
jgi:polyisoprenoid-binding protein YceI